MSDTIYIYIYIYIYVRVRWVKHTIQYNLIIEVKANPIGQSIYKGIKDNDIISRKVYFKTISEEHKALYDKYNTFVRGQRRNSRYGNQELARERERAKEGMIKLSEGRSKDESKQQRKLWGTKYNAKWKLSRESINSNSTAISQVQAITSKTSRSNINCNKYFKWFDWYCT